MGGLSIDVVKGVPAGSERVQGYQFRVTVSELLEVFDGFEQFVGILLDASRFLLMNRPQLPRPFRREVMLRSFQKLPT